MKRKTIIKRARTLVMASVLTVACLGGSVLAAVDEDAAPGFAENFLSPKAENTISTRWWIPGAAVEEEEIRREIQLMAEEDIKNVELVYFPLSVDGRFNVSGDYGWNTEEWKNVLKWAFDEGTKQGVKINLTTGPMWPSMSPLITPDDEAAEKEMNFGLAKLEAGETYTGAVPKPDPSAEEAVTKEELVAVTVAKVNDYAEEVTESYNFFSGETEENTVFSYELDLDSLEDISDMVEDADTENASVTWTAPDDGEYLLFGFWQRGTGQVGNSNSTGMIASEPQSYCIDYLSVPGTEALTDYWELQFLSDEEISSYIRENNPEFFEDSLELIHTLLWTPNMLDEFEDLRGYSMTEYLPLLYGSVDSDIQGGGDMDGVYTFTTNSAETDSLFVEDYEQTVSDLYIENHIQALDAWCEEVGFSYKTQSYGESVDTALAYAYTDVPEGESLEYGEDNYNAFRAVAASAHMMGKEYVSAEYGALMGSGFEMTWDTLLVTFNKIASAGVNRVILHGYPYETYQGSDSINSDTVIPWPGFDPFNDLFADHWNSHVPSWESMDIYTGYINRVQTVLQEGEASMDLAVYGESKDVIDGPYYDSSYLDRIGFTYDIISASLMEAADAAVVNGELTTDTVSYQALIIGDQTNLSAEAAELLLGYAQAGLPIYFVGEIPSAVSTLYEYESQNETLNEIMAEILEQESVKLLGSSDEVLAALEEANITPSAAYETPAEVYNAHRTSEKADYYFFNNAGEESVSMKVELKGNGVPYILDAWSGEISPAAEYEETESGVLINLDLESNEAAIFAVAEENAFGTVSAPVYVTDSELDVVNEDGILYAIAAESGTYETVLNDGTVISTEIQELPESIELKDEPWSLVIESWTQGEAEEGDTSGNSTLKTVLDPISTSLISWSEIDGLADVSGIGTYNIEVEIEDWPEFAHAYLEIGDTIDNIIGIQVNGTELDRLDQLVQKYDLGTLLQNGTNTITITLATTLNNAVNAIGEYAPIFGGTGPQDYGLKGNVTIIPYAKIALE